MNFEDTKSYEPDDLEYLLEQGYLKEIEPTIYRILRKVKLYDMTYCVDDAIHIDEDGYIYVGIGYEETEDEL